MTTLKQATPHRPFCTGYTLDTSATLKLLNYAILINSLLLEYFVYGWVNRVRQKIDCQHFTSLH